MRAFIKLIAILIISFIMMDAWADEGTYILSPKAGTLGTGEELQLQVRKVRPGHPQSQQLNAAEQKNFQWALNSIGAGVETQWGMLIAGLVPGTYIYKAPSVIPSRNPVAVSVSFTDASGQKIILVCNLRITLCKLSFQEEDQEMICLDKLDNSKASAAHILGNGAYSNSNGVTLVSVQGMDKDMKLYTISAMFAGKTAGTYHWDMKACACKVSSEINSKVKNTSQVVIGPPGSPGNIYAMFTCSNCGDEEHCSIVPMEGVINIHEYGPPGGKIRGAIVGTFIKNPPNNDGVQVIFRFEVNRLPDVQ